MSRPYFGILLRLSKPWNLSYIHLYLDIYCYNLAYNQVDILFPSEHTCNMVMFLLLFRVTMSLIILHHHLASYGPGQVIVMLCDQRQLTQCLHIDEFLGCKNEVPVDKDRLEDHTILSSTEYRVERKVILSLRL